MALVLAIEPDTRQAAIIKRILRERVKTELVLTDSKDGAFTTLSKRIPDLILVSALLSPRDEADLTDKLRGLEGAEHLQTLTIPLLAGGPRQPRREEKGGLFGKLKRTRPTPSEGCDPAVFAEEIRGYVERAADARADWAARKERRRQAAEEQARLEAEELRQLEAENARIQAEQTWLDVKHRHQLQTEQEHESQHQTEQEQTDRHHPAPQDDDQHDRGGGSSDPPSESRPPFETQLEAEERARLEAEARALRAAEGEARLQAEAQTRLATERQLQLEIEAQARKQAEEQARHEAERRTQLELEAQRRLEAEERARLEAVEQARLEAEGRKRLEAETQKRLEAEEQARLEAIERARLEAERRVQLEAEAEALRLSEGQVRLEAREQARLAAERQARLEAEAQALRDAEERIRLEGAERARLEAERRQELEAEAEALRQSEGQARLEAREQARLAAERQARLEAEARASRDAEERARLAAAEQARIEAERRAQLEAEARALRQAEEQARLEAKQQARLAADRQARLEAEAQARRKAEQEALLEFKRRRQLEAEARALRDAEMRLRQRDAEQGAITARQQHENPAASAPALGSATPARPMRPDFAWWSASDADRTSSVIDGLLRNIQVHRTADSKRPPSVAAKHSGKKGHVSKPKPLQDEWGLYDPSQAGFDRLLARLQEKENEDLEDEDGPAEQLVQTRAPSHPPTRVGLGPLAMWARIDEPRAPLTFETAPADDLSALMSRLFLPPEVAAVCYATGVRIGRIRVKRRVRKVRQYRSGEPVVILSRKRLKELRKRHALKTEN